MTPASAVRNGEWKLIHYYEEDRLELYNLRTDPGEQHNVASEQPDVLNRLYRELTEWRASVGANEPTPRSK